MSIFLTSGVHAGELVRLANLDGALNAQAGDVLQVAYRRAGDDARITVMPAARASAEAASGRVDGEVARIAEYGEVHPELVRVGPPLKQLAVMACYKKKLTGTIRSVSDLKTYRVGYMRGVVAVERLVAGLPDAQPITSPEQLLRMLDAGRLDVVLGGKETLELHITRLALRNLATTELGRYSMFHYLHRRHVELISRIGEQLKALAASGELDKLFARASNEQREATTGH